MNYERLTRRDMLRVMGAAALLVGSGGCTSNDTKPLPSPEPSKQVFPDATPNATKTPNITAAPTEKPTPKPIEKGPKPEDLNKTDVIFHAKQGVIFTFDDDYSPEWTEQVADIALRKGVPLAFGPIGKNVEKHPETFQNLVNHGFAIFNHTMDHISLAPKKYKGIAILDKNGNYNLEYYEKEYARIRSQIERAEATILDITGKKPLPLLRPPGGLGIFGTQNPILHQVAFDLWKVEQHKYTLKVTPLTLH